MSVFLKVISLIVSFTLLTVQLIAPPIPLTLTFLKVTVGMFISLKVEAVTVLNTPA